MAEKTSIHLGWLEDMKSKIKMYEWFSTLDFSWATLGYGFLYCFIGFLTGLIINKFTKNVIAIVLLTLLIFCIFHYFDVVVVDVVKVKTLIGLKPNDTFESFIATLYYWIKAHKFFTIASLIGFVIGYGFC